MEPTVHVTLQLAGLTCRLGGKTILSGLSLPELSRGQLVALIGPNGCGKSTLLRSIAGLVPARIKLLKLGEQDLSSQSARERSRTLRYLPQSLPQAVHLTVTESMLVAANARQSMPIGSALARAEHVLHSMGIAELGPRYLDELSGGQLQLALLGQILVHEPAVLLLDEPLASLDLNYQHHIMQWLRHLAEESHLLIVVVVHDLNMALRYADIALLMHEGRLMAGGPPAEVITPASLRHVFQLRARVEPGPMGHDQVLVDDLIHP